MWSVENESNNIKSESKRRRGEKRDAGSRVEQQQHSWGSLSVYIGACGRACVLLSFPAYSWCRCAVGGNRCSHHCSGQRYPGQWGV